ncbi:MAG TPA: hypothetical protein VFG73_04725 [Rhodanobacteraceae bacterium]|nr:hypothetical protein [Rhodanobacteraceae bacterium]
MNYQFMNILAGAQRGCEHRAAKATAKHRKPAEARKHRRLAVSGANPNSRRSRQHDPPHTEAMPPAPTRNGRRAPAVAGR